MSNQDRRPGIRSMPQTPQQEAANREAERRQELRSNYLVPLYVMWTSDVPEAEADAAKRGVIDAVAASGQKREVIIFGSSAFNHRNVPFSSPDWYIEEAVRQQALRRDAGFGPQVDAGEIIPLFGQEPYQEIPHWEVLIVNRDLNTKGYNGQYINFIFGETNIVFPASVQSTTRLIREVPAGHLRNSMIRRLLRHEVGHMFGLPSRTDRTEEKLGRHCTNVCTMRQGMSIQEWAALTQQEQRQNVHFCKDCMSDLARLAPKYKPVP